MPLIDSWLRPAAWPLFAFTSLWLSGCEGCSEDRPYTPFGVTSTLPPAVPPSADTVIAQDAGATSPRFTPRVAERVVGTPTRWNQGSRELVAPAPMAFDLAVEADFDGDEAQDAVAWLVATAKEDGGVAPPRGALWYFPATGAPRELSAFPGFVPTSPDCTITVSLTLTGPRSVALDVAATCANERLPRSPVRSLQIIAPNRPVPQIVGFRVAQAAADETLELAVDSTDQDGDGLDDVKLELRVARVNSERPANARWLWLQRAAGLSRDASEPAASFERIGSIEQVRSTGKNTSRGTLDGVDNARRLFASACKESATERIWSWDGSGLGCGTLSVASDRLAHAEVAAALKQNDPLRAFSVLHRASWYTGGVSETKRTELQKLLEASLTETTPVRVQPLAVQLPTLGEQPNYSPLAFDDKGDLLLQSAAGSVRRILAGTHEIQPPPAASGAAGAPPVPSTAPWPLQAVGPSGDRWLLTLQTCNRSEMTLVFGGGTQYGASAAATTILAARPGSCEGHAFSDGFTPVPVAWTAAGLSALVAGQVVDLGSFAVARQAPALGSPLSPDGKTLIVPTELGLLLAQPNHTSLWRLPNAQSASSLHHCVVASTADRAACIRHEQPVLLEPSQESGGAVPQQG